MGRLVDYDDVLKVIREFFDSCEPTEDRDSVAKDFIAMMSKIPSCGEWSYIGKSMKLPPIGKNVLTYGQSGGHSIAYLTQDENNEIVWRKVGKAGRTYMPKAWMYVPKTEDESEECYGTDQ